MLARYVLWVPVVAALAGRETGRVDVRNLEMPLPLIVEFVESEYSNGRGEK